MTEHETHILWQEAYNSGSKCEVHVTTLRGSGNPSRPDKAIHILRSGDMAAIVGDRGRTGPALLKTGNLKEQSKFRTSATFSLKNGGFTKVDVNQVEITNPQDLWLAVFRDHHSKSLEAKAIFVKLVNATAVNDELDPRPRVPTPPPVVKHPYADNRMYGLI